MQRCEAGHFRAKGAHFRHISRGPGRGGGGGEPIKIIPVEINHSVFPSEIYGPGEKIQMVFGIKFLRILLFPNTIPSFSTNLTFYARVIL